MTSAPLSRRGFLAATSVSVLASGPAGAFSIEPAPPAVKALIQAACEAPALHARLVAELEAALEGRDAVPSERVAALAAAACPVCGCALLSESASPGASGR
jgi:hypothetical protein